MKAFVYLLISISVAWSSWGASPKIKMYGTWSGKVGKYPITACFQGTYSPEGNYYYNKYADPIHLDCISKKDTLFPQIWTGEDSSQWIIEKLSDDRASGKWVNLTSSDTLPLSLTLVETEGCAQSSFLTTVYESLPPGKYSYDTIISPTNVKYRVISYEESEPMNGISGSWFEILDTSETYQNINRALNGFSPYDDSSFIDSIVSEAFSSDCPERMMESFGRFGGEEYSSVEPTFWSKHLLGVESIQSWFCGEAHDNSNSTFILYDLITGKVVDFDIYTVLSQSSLKRMGEGMTLGPELKELILSMNRPDPDDPCKEYYEEYEEWYSLELDTAGIIFEMEFPHAIRACDTGYLIPFEVIYPYLSEVGKKIVDAIIDSSK